MATLKKKNMKVRLCTVPFNLYTTNFVRMYFVHHSSTPYNNNISENTIVHT